MNAGTTDLSPSQISTLDIQESRHDRVPSLHKRPYLFCRNIYTSRPLLHSTVYLAGIVSAILYLTLPHLYESQASVVIGQPSQEEFFIQSIIEDWQWFNATSGAIFFMVFAMLQLRNTVDAVDVQTVGFACISCAAVSFGLSSVLLFVFRARNNGHIEVPFNNSGQPDISRAESGIESPENTISHCDIRLRRMLFDDRRTRSVLWNKFVLVALPAIWTTWAGLAFIVFLPLFAWNFHSSTTTSNNTMQTRSAEDDIRISPVMIANMFLPALTVTIVLAIGAVYLMLVIWEFSMRLLA